MHLGDPFALVEQIFTQFLTSNKSDNLDCAFRERVSLFEQKLRGIDSRFDLTLAARLAKLLVEQYDIKR